eukprot:5850744-Lingulodinium_polyedra.AAC.1
MFAVAMRSVGCLPIPFVVNSGCQVVKKVVFYFGEGRATQGARAAHCYGDRSQIFSKLAYDCT